MKKKSVEKQLHSTVNAKVSQSLKEKGFFFKYFLSKSKNLKHFFFSNKIKYFKSNAINTTLSQQNLGGKSLNVGKKVMLVASPHKKVATYHLTYIVKLALRWSYLS